MMGALHNISAEVLIRQERRLVDIQEDDTVRATKCPLTVDAALCPLLNNHSTEPCSRNRGTVFPSPPGNRSAYPNGVHSTTSPGRS
jgi:hypothetical protein